MICRTVAVYLNEQFGDLVSDESLNDWSEYATEWKRAIRGRYRSARPHGPLPKEIVDSFAILDGVFMESTRPLPDSIDSQRFLFSGSNKAHGYAFYGITAPNGLLFIRGPYPGSFNDIQTVIQGDLASNVANFTDGNGNQLKLLCDAIYPENDYLASMPTTQQSHGRDAGELAAIKKVRSAVEHSFSMLYNQWAYLYMCYKHTTNSLPRMHFRAGVLLLNARTCIQRSNQVTRKRNGNMSSNAELFPAKVTVATALSMHAE